MLDKNGVGVTLVKYVVGMEVIWDDDGDMCEGVIEEIHPGTKSSTHCGNLYIVRFKDGNYTRNFDTYSFGRELKLDKKEAA